MKHTPGPWIAVLGTDGRWLVTLADKAWRVVARLWADPESEQNATLIAAAPDMLAALQLARGYVVSCSGGLDEEGDAALIAHNLRLIDSAIAKATNTQGGK